MKGDRGAEYWWQFLRMRSDLYKTILGLEKVMVIVRITKYLSTILLQKDIVFNDKCIVLAKDEIQVFTITQSTLFNEWSWKYGTTLGTGTIVFTPGTTFETFPFIASLIENNLLKDIGQQYHEHRRQLMLNMQLGLTKTYNAFHAKEIQPGITTAALQNLDKKTIEKQYGKEVWNLWNHLQKTQGTCSIEEAIAGIIKLRELHAEMDEAVLEAYGWVVVKLKHDFYEVDYLPENDRVRFTIHPEARKEILKRLLELNHKIHEEEVAAGLWDKKKPKDYKTAKAKAGTANEAESIYKQQSLFEEDNLFNQEN